MGTHPIFESDFDCLTGMVRLKRSIVVGLFTLATLAGLINAQSNWIFYGTEYRAVKGRSAQESTTLSALFQPGNERQIEQLKRYLKENASESDNILRNFRQTPIIRHEVKDKAYYDDKLLDHACPVTVRASVKEQKNRIPDIIGVGFAKCGTGALAFLDCHQRAVFRTTEPRFFDQRSKLQQIIKAADDNDFETLNRLRNDYAKKVPLAADDELLIEKSPQYAGGSEDIRRLRARAMKIINPNLKLLAVVCDPIRRAFSQLSMKDRRTKDRQASGRSDEKRPCRSCLKGDLPQAIARFTTTMQQHWSEGRESGYAAFSNYLEPFLEVFGENNILIIDGENLIRNANWEFKRIVDFIGLDSTHFKFNIPDQKGFPCLLQPIKFCLNGAKGTSRKVDVTKVYPEKTAIWKKTFSVSIKKTIKAFKICAEVDDACCAKLNNRFTWAKKYFC